MIRLVSVFLAALVTARAMPESLSNFISRAEATHGAAGARAAQFLIEHMPEADRKGLSTAFLSENLDLAFKARDTFPWSRDIPEEIFLNDVLPYAVFDEPRDPWRADFMAKAAPIVEGAQTSSEAAQRLNRQFFKLINTHYDPGRKRTNQSPKESIEQGKATCTGLSIILVDACRAVGIPARAVGIPLWPNKRGNHTWVEIYDQGQWHYTGADEPNDKGLNHAWFTKAASAAIQDHPLHAIYATSWEPQGTHFPMVWARDSKEVGAVNVTTRYSGPKRIAHQVGIRLFSDESRGSRIATKGWLTTADGSVIEPFTTKAGTSDLNDMPQVTVAPGERYRLRFMVDTQLMESMPFTAARGTSTIDLRIGELRTVSARMPAQALTREQAEAAIQKTYAALLAKQKEKRSKELGQKSITIGEHQLKWLEKTFGDAPAGERSLWISMHGGGGAPEQVNTQQWRNQFKLYQPKEGIYLTPRAPTNTWNLWHQKHIDPLFSRLIENMVALRGVDPDKVYLMGYSAGGDGVWQLAPRMADRYAAASMMAGHPNEAKLLGLRNLPFGIFCGALDHQHKRNEVCAQRIKQIKKLAEADPGGYLNMTRLYEGMGHWMKLKDAEALPWMAKFSRNPWPHKIVWYQDNVTHDRFYWLELPEGRATKGQRIDAAVSGQTITLTGDIPKGMRLLLHDKLLDLDQPVTVIVNRATPTQHQVERHAGIIRKALRQRLDPKSTPTAAIVID